MQPDFAAQAARILEEIPILGDKICFSTKVQPEELPHLLVEMLRFLHLAATCGERVSPSHIIDLAWHEFILFTRYYADFCRQQWGEFVHHQPGGKEAENKLAFKKTHYFYTQLFNQEPDARYWGRLTAAIADHSDCGLG